MLQATNQPIHGWCTEVVAVRFGLIWFSGPIRFLALGPCVLQRPPCSPGGWVGGLPRRHILAPAVALDTIGHSALLSGLGPPRPEHLRRMWVFWPRGGSCSLGAAAICVPLPWVLVRGGVSPSDRLLLAVAVWWPFCLGLCELPWFVLIMGDKPREQANTHRPPPFPHRTAAGTRPWRGGGLGWACRSGRFPRHTQGGACCRRKEPEGLPGKGPWSRRPQQCRAACTKPAVPLPHPHPVR